MRKISWLDPTLRQADTVQVMVQVHQGKLSPEAAEEWAKANGRPPFVPAIGSAPNPMEKADWPFTLAAAWILTREPIQALKASMEYEFWGRDSRKQQAQTDLWHQLRSGQAHATGVKAGSEERVAIRAVEWNDLTWMRFGTGDIISFRGGRSAVYQDVRIEARDIYRLWPELKPSEVKAATTACTIGAGRARKETLSCGGCGSLARSGVEKSQRKQAASKRAEAISTFSKLSSTSV